jgi:hypothetical protein
MSTIIITYDAKCKHCLFFKYKNLLNKSGEKSKVKRAFCTNQDSEMFENQLTLKSEACNKLKL